MYEFINAYEAPLRLSCFIVTLLLLMAAQSLFPKRTLAQPLKPRWITNFTMAALGALLTRLVLPVAAISTADFAKTNGIGVFNNLELPSWLEVVIACLALDLCIYVQHRVFHTVPVLWRLHRMHHTDMDLDVSSGLRFHPLEFALSMAIKCVVVLLLGAPILAVLLFEVVLNATSLFNHSNLALHFKLDHRLRYLIVTPDMHRVHHSTIPSETDTNFGFNLPWWDFLFGTYLAQPKWGHQHMKIGLNEFRDSSSQTLAKLLVQPFMSSTPKQNS
jgi:sterol desaturase/sphingolipid hydroxylase (fatty acid hydroxylase superfamily)